MSTSQTATGIRHKQRDYRFWVSCSILIMGLGVLGYYGYCFGWWGRNSLLLQYFFQCHCPTASEKTRYSEQVDIIIPACRAVNTGIKLLPSGRFLYLLEEENGLAATYLLDLQTMERIKVTDQQFSSFITDDLWFIEGGVNSYIIDRITGTQYPIKTFRYWRKNAYVNGAPNLELLISALHQAEQIFFTQNNDVVIVLMSNFPTDVEKNLTFGRFDIPGGDPDRVEQFLQENNIAYQTVLADLLYEVVSRDGRFIARDDGIYLSETNQMIDKAPIPGVRGWTYDGRGVIYASSLCLFQTSFPGDGGCLQRVPQPVIKLKVSDEYLSSKQTP